MIYPEHTGYRKNSEYDFMINMCKTCNVLFCRECINYHIFLHYKGCNEKFKQDISPITEELISKDVVQNILMEYIEM